MVRLPEVLISIPNTLKTWRSELEKEWRRSELELKSDAYGYYLYLDMQAGKITPEEFQQKIERANQDFGLDLVPDFRKLVS